MADDQSTEESSATEEPEEQLQDPGKKALDAERRARRVAEKQLNELQSRLKELEDADKSESVKMAERAATAEKQAQDAMSNYLRLKVGTTKGLAPEVADRLRGSNEEEMAADADQLLQVLRPKEASGAAFDAGARQSAPEGDWNAALRRVVS